LFFPDFFKRLAASQIFLIEKASGAKSRRSKGHKKQCFLHVKTFETRINPWPTTKMFHVKHF